MKIRSVIVLFIYLSMGQMTSMAKGNGKDGSCVSLFNLMKSDTSVMNQFIKIDSFNLSILPPSSGIQFYKDGILFLSSSKSEGKMLPNHLSFGTVDTYYAVLKDSTLENHLVFSPSSSFPYPSDAITFSSDFSTMYFTKYSKIDGFEKIYQAKFSSGNKNQGDWSFDTNPVSFCSDQSTYIQPALSADGGIMIFASNRTGSVGGMDLFITRNNGDTWSAPVNIDEAINTKFNELYPFLDSENNLFFSSDGLHGYGGYDIFVCKFNGKTWEKPINLSTPVNTEFDDVAFKINRKDGKSAFFTVKQKGGKRSSQLYIVTINSDKTPKKLSNLSKLFTSPGLPNIKVQETITAATDESVRKLPDTTKTKTEVVKKELEVKTRQEIGPQSQVKSVSKVEQSGAVSSKSSEKKEAVVYRVQIFSGGTNKGSTKITINNKIYKTFEYYYNGGNRTCIGEFSMLASAKDFQNICRKSGYPQAFVVAFKNNVRSIDPALFK